MSTLYTHDDYIYIVDQINCNIERMTVAEYLEEWGNTECHGGGSKYRITSKIVDFAPEGSDDSDERQVFCFDEHSVANGRYIQTLFESEDEREVLAHYYGRLRDIEASRSSDAPNYTYSLDRACRAIAEYHEEAGTIKEEFGKRLYSEFDYLEV